MEILGMPAGRLFCALAALACILACIAVGFAIGPVPAFAMGAVLCTIASAIVAVLASRGARGE